MNCTHKPLILVVDDEAIQREVLVELLDLLGYEGIAAADGAEALRLLGEREFSAVLLDWQLPDLTGPEVAHRLRSREGDARRTPVIAVTANAAEDVGERCLAAGIDDIIGKPYHAEDLADRLRRWTAEPGRPTGEQGPLLDVTTVALMHQLRLVGRLYPTFIAILPEQMATLRAALAAGDRAAARRHAHRLRGSAAQLGAVALARALGEIEDLAADGSRCLEPPSDAALDELVRTTTAALLLEIDAIGARRPSPPRPLH